MHSFITVCNVSTLTTCYAELNGRPRPRAVIPVSEENMFSLQSIKAWFLSRRLKPLRELLGVEFDDARVKVLVLTRLDPAWNQEFVWTTSRAFVSRMKACTLQTRSSSNCTDEAAAVPAWRAGRGGSHSALRDKWRIFLSSRLVSWYGRRNLGQTNSCPIALLYR